MKKTRIFFTALLVLLTAISVNAQNITVSGTVSDASTGEAVPFASVQVKGTRTGAAADASGHYEIQCPKDAVLIFSFIGYVNSEYPVYGKTTLNVSIKLDNKLLDEAVVTALGITKSEKALGYSVSKVSGDELAVSRNTNVTNALQGKVAGMQISATSTDPGAANSIIIRGFSSINGSNQPLYVIDGVIVSERSLSSQGHDIATGGLASIPSDDIQSISVLKGAAATALYGSMASGGVIIVTTKSGRKGPQHNFSIEYNGGMQFRQVSTFPVMQNEFGQGWTGQQTFIENGSWGPALDGSLQVYGPIWNNQQKYHYYDAKENNVKDFFEIGISHNHSISLSGASEDNKLTYYLSYSYSSDNGIMPSDKDLYKRNTIALRSTYAGEDWLKISSNVNLTTSATDIVGNYQGTSVIDGLYEFPRDLSIVDLKDLSSAFNTPEAYLTPYGITNPYWAIANNYNHTDANQVFGKIQADIKPWKNLTITYRYGFDFYNYDRKQGYPQIELDDALINDDMGYAPSSMNQDGYVYTRYYRAYNSNHDVMANYSNSFFNGKLELTAIAGFNAYSTYLTATSGETDKLTFPTGFWQLSNGATKTTLTEVQQRKRMLGAYADISLGWNDMLFLDVTARNDWSSTLPIQNNSYFYPGATLSWVFSELIPENKVLTLGKIRLAYGKTGRDAGLYQTSVNWSQASASTTYCTPIQFPLNGMNAFLSSTTMGSTTLRPEMTKEFEIGANIQLFNGRIGLDAAFYNRITSDQIFSLPCDPATGYNTMVTNFGDVRNRGIELLLTTTPVQTRDFRWDLDFNFAINRNMVLSMPESLEGGKVTINSFSTAQDALYLYAEEGHPMGTYWATNGRFVEDKNSEFYGYRIVDANGQPTTTESAYTGKTINNKWTGGITTSLSYKGISLSATLDARVGGYMFSRTKNLMQFTGNGLVTLYNKRRPFVIPNSVVENADGSYSPNSTPISLGDSSFQNYFDKYGWGNGSSSYLVDRSFAKLRNITLGYNLPKAWASKLYLSDITLSAFVNNVFTWTAAENLYIDPELSTTGTDLAGTFGELYVNPACRIWGFNVRIKF